MNTTFSINRLGLLIKRYFVENKQRELTFWGITTIVFLIMHQTSQEVIYFYISGFIFASRMFKIFGYTPGGMHYLLIPATHLEKMVTAIILSTFYFFVMFLITYTAGTTLGITLSNAIFETHNPIALDLFQIGSIPNAFGNTFIQHNGFWNIFLGFAIIQSIFMLGSVYFKRNAIGKTFMALTCLGIILGILEFFMLKSTFGTMHTMQSININIGSGENIFPGFEIAGQIIKYLTIPFLWLVTYYRLTEKQV